MFARFFITDPPESEEGNTTFAHGMGINNSSFCGDYKENAGKGL